MANQPTKYRKFVIGAASAALVATAVAPVASAADFKDTKGNTHQEAINALSDAGVISGYPDGTFQPNKTLTRSDVVKLLGKWLVKEGASIPADAVSKPRFSDLTSKSNKELLEYAAVVKDNGVFNGSNGRLLAGDKISRENMAVVIVRAFDSVKKIDLNTYVAGQEFKRDVTDLASAKAEAQGAIDVLDFFDITNPTVASFNPKGSTTRGHFATFLHKAINTDYSKVTGVTTGATAAVKAINATTVEVSFKEAITDINSLKFTIEGLAISNAAVKQTDSKVVVLTTAVQTGDKEYTVKSGENTIGTFKGISGVIPTKITITTSSVQGVVGKEVTLKADIGVKEAGVPVTFNVAAGSKLNKDFIEEVTTNADGVATYSYTQYVAGLSDEVVAYPTGAPAVRSLATVYWGVDSILTVKAQDDKQGNSVANGASKVYKVTYKDPKTGTAVANQKMHVSFVENVGVTIDKMSKATVNGTNPTQLANGTAPMTAEVVTDSKGEATFTVSGHNTSVTPVVFLNQVVNNTDVKTWDATKLQAQAEKLVFGATQADYVIDVTREGGEEAARYEANGREYKVVLKTKDGKAAANEIVNVAFNEDIDRNINTNTKAYFTDDDKKVTGTAKQITVKTDAKGEATFTISSDDLKDYATPIVWLDINTSNAKDGNFDDGEPFKIAPISYFADAKLTEGAVKAYLVTTKDTAKVEFTGLETAVFKFTAANQSGKAMSLPAGYDRIEASFTVFNNGANEITVNGQVVSPNRSLTTSTISAVVPEIKVESVGNKTTSVEVKANGTAIPNATNKTDRPINLGNHTAKANFTSTLDAPNFVASTPVEWANLEKNTMKLTKYNGVIDYTKARFFVADEILKGGTGSLTAAQTYTETTLYDFERFIAGGSTVTFTKGTDGAHTIRLEVKGTGSTTGAVTTSDAFVAPTTVTPGVGTAESAKAAQFKSAAIVTSNFPSATLNLTVGSVATAPTAAINIDGTDTAEVIAGKINAALPTVVTATVVDNRVVITVKDTAATLTVTSTVAAFGSVVVSPTPAKVVAVGTATYTFTADIVDGQKVTVNGKVYTAGTVTNGTTFVASGTLAEDLTNLAVSVTVQDSSLSATSAATVLTLTEKAGQEGKASFTSIGIKN
ncbi:S-layer homology domain-containing protein [Sporosarcina limicola]|uniref:SLH domain-containing protein n=1 Tax=Sporosarcina limicola TaxID=34101 RepID=A0A927R5H7_9BACL|nr:S-layer homology domain-containing protein [Sporosarcina limicola]MBE1556053.1 hypothetical protein [Sporosarcina limicola]